MPQEHGTIVHTDGPSGAGGVHVIPRWVAADAATRRALTVAAADVGGVCHQTDTGQAFYLRSASPDIWVPFAGPKTVFSPSVINGDQNNYNGGDADDWSEAQVVVLSALNTGSATNPGLIVMRGFSSTNLAVDMKKIILEGDWGILFSDTDGGSSAANQFQLPFPDPTDGSAKQMLNMTPGDAQDWWHNGTIWRPV